MLKIEDLKVGDELEFISDESKEGFLNDYHHNDLMLHNCLSMGVGLVSRVTSMYVYLRCKDESILSCLSEGELKYFRKVVHKQEDTTNTLVNANIKSYEEMYKRLIDGEVFDYKGGTVSYDKEYGNFLYKDKLLGAYKSEFKHFQVQKPWWEFTSEENPILCKVWDGEEPYSDNQIFEMVTGYTNGTVYPFKGISTWGVCNTCEA